MLGRVAGKVDKHGITSAAELRERAEVTGVSERRCDWWALPFEGLV
jgi:hypothetical protein